MNQLKKIKELPEKALLVWMGIVLFVVTGRADQKRLRELQCFTHLFKKLPFNFRRYQKKISERLCNSLTHLAMCSAGQNKR
jgi:hypothetical protein